jgi:hypothetical protein
MKMAARCIKPYEMRPAVFLILLAAAGGACTPNQRIMESVAKDSPTPAVVEKTPAPIGFEADLDAMRTADFRFILVFRRRDGAPLDAEDKAFINANTPPDVNRRRLSDDGRAVIIGSNFPFLPGTIAALTDRFVMEDHSKADAGPLEVDRTGNSNSAKNGPGKRRGGNADNLDAEQR